MVKNINKKDLLKRGLIRIGIFFAKVLAGVAGFWVAVTLQRVWCLMWF